MERVAVAYNDDAARKTHLSDIELRGEVEVIDTAQEIAAVLNAALVPVGDDIAGALQRLRGFDVVVDLCEGVAGNPRYEMHFALALEMLGIAHTSCDPIAVGTCTDKALVTRLLRAAGIATPRSREDGGRFPLIVKPSLEDAGIGIDAASVVTNDAELATRIAFVVETYRQPALVEEFIDGRELNQSVFLGTALAAGEVVFADDLAPHERVVGWKAKWANGSREDLATVNRTPAHIDDATRDRLASTCLRAASVLGLDMYARFDVRESANGELYLIDINPNADLGRGTGFRKALDAAGTTFPDFLNALIIAARARRHA
jgi:D-alanine-D-alanine ligase